MTSWIEDPSMEAPEGHRWMKPAPDECPNCPCHTLRVCRDRLWDQSSRPVYDNGMPYTGPCRCEEQR